MPQCGSMETGQTLILKSYYKGPFCHSDSIDRMTADAFAVILMHNNCNARLSWMNSIVAIVKIKHKSKSPLNCYNGFLS